MKNMEDKVTDAIMGQLLYDDQDESEGAIPGIDIPEGIQEIIFSDDQNNKRLTNKKSKNKNYIPRIDIEQLKDIREWINTLSVEQIKAEKRLTNLSKNIDGFIERHRNTMNKEKHWVKEIVGKNELPISNTGNSSQYTNKNTISQLNLKYRVLFY